MTAHHAFLHHLLIKWCLTFPKTFLKEHSEAKVLQNNKIQELTPSQTGVHQWYLMGAVVLSPPWFLSD